MLYCNNVYCLLGNCFKVLVNEHVCDCREHVVASSPCRLYMWCVVVATRNKLNVHTTTCLSILIPPDADDLDLFNTDHVYIVLDSFYVT